jgi:hypothetical protein
VVWETQCNNTTSTSVCGCGCVLKVRYDCLLRTLQLQVEEKITQQTQLEEERGRCPGLRNLPQLPPTTTLPTHILHSSCPLLWYVEFKKGKAIKSLRIVPLNLVCHATRIDACPRCVGVVAGVPPARQWPRVPGSSSLWSTALNFTFFLEPRKLETKVGNKQKKLLFPKQKHKPTRWRGS